MYKVIIVDDESAVRERLLNQLKKVGDIFEVVGSYENGFEALSNGISLNPDLLITDVKMPYVNGIELIKRIKLELPLIQSIIISGFDSFDYAKQAIELGVIGYISKPITFSELEETLLKAKNFLDNKLKINKDLALIQQETDKILKLTQQQDLLELIKLKDLPDHFKTKLAADQIDLNYHYSILGTFDFDLQQDALTYKDIELANYYIEKYVNEELAEEDLDFYLFAGIESFIILVLSDELFEKETLQRIFSTIIGKIKKGSDVSISIGFSEVGGGINSNTSFRKLYRHAKRALEYRTVVGGNLTLFFDEVDNRDVSTGKIDENEYRNISYELIYGRTTEAKVLIQRILDILQNDKFKTTYHYILNNLINCILKACVSLNELFNTYMSQYEIVHKLFNAKTNEEISTFVFELVDRIAKINTSSRLTGVELTYNSIQNYLKSNYKNSMLSLEDVANELNYSVSYISAILKKNKTSFTKSLTDIRMEEAKILLGNLENKLLTIAHEVGYEDAYYFSYCFKKYTGMTPLEYRKK